MNKLLIAKNSSGSQKIFRTLCFKIISEIYQYYIYHEFFIIFFLYFWLTHRYRRLLTRSDLNFNGWKSTVGICFWIYNKIPEHVNMLMSKCLKRGNDAFMIDSFPPGGLPKRNI